MTFDTSHVHTSPSPDSLPLRAASTIASTTVSAIEVSTMNTSSALGRNRDSNTRPRYSCVTPRSRPWPIASITVTPTWPLASSTASITVSTRSRMTTASTLITRLPLSPASAFHQDGVAPEAVALADPLAHADHAEADRAMQLQGRFVLREDRRLDRPNRVALAPLDQALHQRAADAAALGVARDVDARLRDAAIRPALRHWAERRPADDVLELVLGDERDRVIRLPLLPRGHLDLEGREAGPHPVPVDLGDLRPIVRTEIAHDDFDRGQQSKYNPNSAGCGRRRTASISFSRL